MTKYSKIINKFLILSYYFVMISFFMPIKINSIALIVCGFFSLLNIKKLPYKKFIQFPVLLFLFLFLLLLLGMTYTENLNTGKAVLERHYSLLFIPFVVSSY